MMTAFVDVLDRLHGAAATVFKKIADGELRNIAIEKPGSKPGVTSSTARRLKPWRRPIS